MSFPRSSGILLHPSSLPSRGGIGDFGPAAYEFVNFLTEARQTLWQVLPLAPTGYGNSPYSATSAFAGNPLLISLERLAEHGWLDKRRLSTLPSPTGSVDFQWVSAAKMPIIEEAALNFLGRARPEQRQRFDHFCNQNREWLDDFVLFRFLRRHFDGKQWSAWPREFAQRDPAALQRVRIESKEALVIEEVIQFFFSEQWDALRTACHRRGIRIVGDVAIFVSYDSADVWTHREIFSLLPDGQPEFVAGVPPDAFSATGQRWGNPLYRWDVLKSRGYDWWIARMRATLRICDIVRLDHFRGFEQYWQIPAGEPTAVNGRWVPGPGDDLFRALHAALGNLPFVAEDLGFITPEVHALRDRLDMPGMRVMQFGFADPGAEMYLPHRYHPNVVAYTGTHDNDTTRGWWQHVATEAERVAAGQYLGTRNESDIAWAMIGALESSVADTVIVPLQDVLNLGSEARMNVPSRPDGNWAWRFLPGQLTPEIAQRLKGLIEATHRFNPQLLASHQQGNREVAEDFAA